MAALHQSFSTTPTVSRIVSASAKFARKQPDFSVALESRLISQLTPKKCLTIVKEMPPLALQDFSPIASLRVVNITGYRRPADCWLEWTHVDGTTTRVPVNIKGIGERTKAASSDFAVAIGPLLSWMTEADGRIDSQFRGSPDNVLRELLAGTRKLYPGRDYYIWSIESLPNQPVVHTLRSLVAHHHSSGSGLAITRHTSRDVISYHAKFGPVIGPKVDIARELAVALLPRAGRGRLHIEILAALPVEQRRDVALILESVTEEELAQRIAVALG